MYQNGHALIGFRGLMLQAWSEKPNSVLRPLKKKGFKEERVTTIGLYGIGKSHDPGIQQEPREFTSHRPPPVSTRIGGRLHNHHLPWGIQDHHPRGLEV